MSDRIAVMNRGRYEQLGNPEELYERPATHFVAGFLGVSNLLSARREGTADGYALLRFADGTAVRAPAAALDGKSAVMVGVRPEKIRLQAVNDDLPAGQNHMLGRVRDASYLGVSTSYVVESRHGERLTVYEQNVERTSHRSLHRPGDEVQLSWSPDHTFAVSIDDAPGPTGNHAVEALDAASEGVLTA